jgi:hypothetical protein
VIRQGDVFWVDLGTPSGSGPGLLHPYVVIQNDIYNRSRLSTVVVCQPQTGGKPGEHSPGRRRSEPSQEERRQCHPGLYGGQGRPHREAWNPVIRACPANPGRHLRCPRTPRHPVTDVPQARGLYCPTSPEEREGGVTGPWLGRDVPGSRCFP